MTGQADITNQDLASAKLYHRNRAEEEAKRALAAQDPHARSSHEALSALHIQACHQLDGVAVLRAEVRHSIG